MEMKKILAQPEVRQRFESQGFSAIATPPEAFATFLQSEVAKWAKVVKDSGATVD
jgi:tripartite-type tricarboxylate transporter receptor subunit TctC